MGPYAILLRTRGNSMFPGICERQSYSRLAFYPPTAARSALN